MNDKNIILWLQNWYQSQCNEDWKHSFGIKIDTVDNPGWWVEIDLNETKWKDLHIPSKSVEHNDNDWYFFKIEDSKFKASGDPSKLEIIFKEFRQIIESEET
jgi:hypothetical protein